MTQVVYSKHPLLPSADRTRYEYTGTLARPTLLCVLDELNLNPRSLDVHAYVNGTLVPRGEWNTHEVKSHDLITLKARLHGGDDSNPLAVIATIALMIFAPYAAPALGLTGMAASAFTAGIMVAGTVLINHLFPPKVPKIEQDKAGDSFTIAGGRNVARIGEPLPVVVGTHRVFADLGAKPYLSQTGNDIFLHQIFNFGFGNLLIDDVRIGETDIEDYNEVNTQWSDPVSGEITLFPGNVDPTAGATLEPPASPADTSNWVTRTTSTDTTSIQIDIEAAVFAYNDDGNITFERVQIDVQYKPVISETWSTLNTPQDWWTGNQWVIPDDPTIGQLIQGTVNGWLVTQDFGNLIIHNNTTEPVRKTIGFDVPKGQYDVRVRRVTQAYNSDRRVANVTWSQLKSFQPDPASYADQTRLAVRIKASNQLNGTIESLNAQVSALIPVWNEGSGSFVTQATSNPAWIFLYLARGKKNAAGRRLFGGGLSDNRIDIEGIKEWAEWCDEHELECNYLFNQRMIMEEMLALVARCGRGSPSWQKGILGVVYDREELPITQMFNMANIIKGSFNVTYLSDKLADQIVVKFLNRDLDYQMDEVRVNMPGVANPLNPAEIEIQGITTVAQAIKEANLLAARQKYHRRIATITTDIEGLMCGKGDVIGISHDVTNWGASGRLISGTTTTLKLNRQVTFTSNAAYYVMIRYPDGESVIREVTNPFTSTPVTTDTITLEDALPSAPDADTDNDPRDYLFSFDPKETPGRKFKIISVTPSENNQVRLSCADEVDEYYEAEDNAYTYVPPAGGSAAGAPVLTNVQINEEYVGLDRPLVLHVTWDIENANETMIRWRQNAGIWTQVDGLRSNYYRLNLNDYRNNDLIEFQLTARNTSFARANSDTVEATYYIDGLPEVANNQRVPVVSGLELFEADGGNQFKGRDAKFTWRRNSTTTPEFGSEQGGAEEGAPDDFFADYRVHILDLDGALRREEHVKNEEYIYSYEKNVEDSVRLDNDPEAVRSFEIRVWIRTRTNLVSPQPAKLTVSNPPPEVTGIDVTPGFDAIHISCETPKDTDYQGVLIWMDTTTSFTPTGIEQGVGNCVYRGPGNYFPVTGLTSEQTRYVRIAAFDAFTFDEPSDLLISSEFTATTLLIPAADVDLDDYFPIEDPDLIGDHVIGEDHFDVPWMEYVEGIEDVGTDNQQDIALMGARNGAASAFILDSDTVKLDSDGGDTLASRFSALTAADGANSASIASEALTRASEDEALALDITALESDLTTLDGTVSGNSSAISGLQTDVTTLEGTVSSHAGQLTSLESTIDLRARTFRQSSAPTADNTGDLWIDSDDNKLYRWNGSSWVNVQDAAIGANASAISSLETDVSTLDGTITAVASDVTTLESTVSGIEGDLASAEITIAAHTTAISTAEGDITTLEAKYGVRLNVNGHVSGFVQNNNGTTSDFIIQATNFKIIDPGNSLGTATVPFAVTSGTVFLANTAVNGSLLVNGTVTANKVNTSSLSALSADLGTITSGTITLNSTGHIKSGQSAFDSGTGWYLGIDSGTPKFSVGNSSGDKFSWDGSTLTVAGNVQITSVGSFTPTWSGFSANPTGTMYYHDLGTLVMMWWIGTLGTSNSSSFSFSGVPAGIRPSSDIDVVTSAARGATTVSLARIHTDGSVTLFNSDTSSAIGTSEAVIFANDWNNSGTKGLLRVPLIWPTN